MRVWALATENAQNLCRTGIGPVIFSVLAVQMRTRATSTKFDLTGKPHARLKNLTSKDKFLS